MAKYTNTCARMHRKTAGSTESRGSSYVLCFYNFRHFTDLFHRHCDHIWTSYVAYIFVLVQNKTAQPHITPSTRHQSSRGRKSALSMSSLPLLLCSDKGEERCPMRQCPPQKTAMKDFHMEKSSAQVRVEIGIMERTIVESQAFFFSLRMTVYRMRGRLLRCHPGQQCRWVNNSTGFKRKISCSCLLFWGIWEGMLFSSVWWISISYFTQIKKQTNKHVFQNRIILGFTFFFLCCKLTRTLQEVCTC